MRPPGPGAAVDEAERAGSLVRDKERDLRGEGPASIENTTGGDAASPADEVHGRHERRARTGVGRGAVLVAMHPGTAQCAPR